MGPTKNPAHKLRETDAVQFHWSGAGEEILIRMDRLARYILRVMAVVLIALGLIWILQGINVLPGSFMTGQIQWAYRGGVAAGVGVLLFALTWRGRK
jgi:hypothetical protein